MQTFVAQLSDKSDDFTIDFTVGDHTIRGHFVWATVIQEQHDLFLAYIRTLSESDPLADFAGDVTREYDYLEYYCDAVPDVITSDWIREQEALPATMHGRDADVLVSVFRERKIEALAMRDILEVLKEQLYWHVTFTEDSDVTTAGIIQGGWYRNQDNSWAVRFVTADGDTVPKDRLVTVTLEFEVYDGE